MSLITHKLAAATAVAAAFSMVATPAWAAELPRAPGQVQTWDADALNVEGRGRHGGHRGHHDDDWDIDGGDVLTGVLILGGLAAIAGIAGSGKNRERSYPEASYPEPEPYRGDAGYQAPQTGYRSGGMSAAVDTCVAEVEAGRGRVGSVDRASRAGEGWYVAGELEGGADYACWTDGAGRVTNIEAGEYGADYEAPADEAAPYTTVQKQAVDDDRYALAQAGE
jgi:hypothetical protein